MMGTYLTTEALGQPPEPAYLTEEALRATGGQKEEPVKEPAKAGLGTSTIVVLGAALAALLLLGVIKLK